MVRRRIVRRQSNSKKANIFWLILILGFLTVSKHSQNFSRFGWNSYYIPNAGKIVPINLLPGDRNLVDLDFEKIDQQAITIKYSGKSVSELSKLLAKQATTEAEKARIIYTWIAHNIDYDVEGFYSGQYADVSPRGVLTNRRAVCSGYANLYQALATNIGLESFVISGYAKGLSYLTGDPKKPNHAWNAVKINNGWYLIDVTWGAGGVKNKEFKRRFSNFYFATPPEQLIYSHLPTNPRWQLLSNSYNQAEFFQLPWVSPQFFITQLQLLSKSYNQQGKLQVLLKVPENVKVTAGLTYQEEQLSKEYIKIHRNNEQVLITMDNPGSKADYLKVYAKFSDQEGDYPHAFSLRLQERK